MANITVTCTESNEGWDCEVKVSDSGSSSHTVEVPREDYQDLTGESETDVETLVEESFEFLLEREPQSAIMSSFDIRTIERYFPEYPDKISDRLGKTGP